MGTTCTAIVVADRRLYLAHVGDSRAYLLRGGQLRQLTIDHTWAEEAIRAGRAPEEIRTHPNRGVIMRYLGIDPTVNIDTRYRDAAGEIVDTLQAGPLFLEPGDTLMLCSDGVSDSLDARQVAEFLAYPDCQTAADALVSNALEAGATDNVTALVLRLPGGVVAPPAALAPAGKKLPVLPIVLAALALLLVGVVAVLALSGRGRSQPTPQPTAAVGVAPTAIAGRRHGAPARNDRRGAVARHASTTYDDQRGHPADGQRDGTAIAANAITASGTVTGTASVAGEPTVIPTFTVVPTRALATITPRPTATPRAATATSPSQPGGPSGGVTLKQPPPNEGIKGAFTFMWEDNSGFVLKTDEKYELIFWKPGQNPILAGKRPVAATREREVRVDLVAADQVNDEFGLFLEPGPYFWGVALRSAKNIRLRLLSEQRPFTYDRPGNGPNNGSNPDFG